MTVDGFADGQPVQAKVSWVPDETPLWDGHVTPYGLLANIPGQGGVTRYFVPWGQITYLKQWIPDGPAPVTPTNLTPR